MIYELTVFTIALIIFGAIMYVWHNHLSPFREPNKKLLDNAKKWKEDNHRMNVIGQNGNDGLHYNINKTEDGEKTKLEGKNNI